MENYSRRGDLIGSDVARTTHEMYTAVDYSEEPLFIDTRPLLQTHPWHAYPYMVAITASLILGVLGNIAIIGAHAFYKKLQKSGNTVVINLAIADLCVAGLSDPMCILGVVKGKEYFDKHPIFCEGIACFCLTACICAFLNLGFFSLNRYMYICHKYTYCKIFGRKTIIVGCIAVWITAFGLELPNLLGWGKHYFDIKNHQCMWDRKGSKEYRYFIFAVLGSVLLLMTMAYLSICWKIMKTKKQLLKFSGLKGKQLFKKEWAETIRCCKTTVTVVVFYTICWAPYAVILLFDFNDDYPMWVHLWFTFLAHFHSVINFFIYVKCNRDYRVGFSKFVCGAILRKSRNQDQKKILFKNPRESSSDYNTKKEETIEVSSASGSTKG